MANEFYAEVASNYEQKCLCVLVLDTSGSMLEVTGGDIRQTGRQEMIDGKLYNIVEGGTTKMDGLNAGLKQFYDDIYNDDISSQRIEVAIVTFNSRVETIQQPALVENFRMPTLRAGGETALVDAMMVATNLVESRKQWYKSTGQPYYRPWIILMTDGEPDQNQDVVALTSKIKSDTANKRYIFLPIGVDNANMEFLKTIEGEGNGYVPAMNLSAAKFSSFFKWLSASIETVFNSDDSAPTSTQDSGTWWEDFYDIK